MTRSFCRRCNRPVDSLGGSAGARLRFAVVALLSCFWLGMMPLGGMLMIGLIPLIFLLGLGIGPAYAAAFPDRTCRECGAVVDPLPTTVGTATARRAPLTARGV